MNADQQAMDRFGDFLKLLAQGCHVRIGEFVYVACKSGHIISIHVERYEFGRGVGYECNKTTSFWLNLLRRCDMEVVYPLKPTVSVRHVRSVEL